MKKLSYPRDTNRGNIQEYFPHKKREFKLNNDNLFGLYALLAAIAGVLAILYFFS